MLAKNSCVGIRPCNCDSEWGTTARCPNCKQAHLRPGYCQALDPINAAKYPQFHPDKRGKVPSRHRADTATLSDENVAAQQIQPKHVTDNASDVTDSASDVTDKCDANTPCTVICDECHGYFVPKRKDAKLCSPACRKSASRKKQKSPQ